MARNTFEVLRGDTLLSWIANIVGRRFKNPRMVRSILKYQTQSQLVIGIQIKEQSAIQILKRIYSSALILISPFPLKYLVQSTTISASHMVKVIIHVRTKIRDTSYQVPAALNQRGVVLSWEIAIPHPPWETWSWCSSLQQIYRGSPSESHAATVKDLAYSIPLEEYRRHFDKFGRHRMVTVLLIWFLQT